jgi:ABC-type multidrug transport system ATPase subunit
MVLLTALTSMVALLPLWFGQVDRVGQPFVAVLCGGLLLGTPATLLLLPALQALGAPRRKRGRLRWRADGRDLVELRSLSRSFGRVRALRPLSLKLEPGMIGLLGPNGAGKTTLMRCLVGVLRADTGDVWVNGVPRRDDPDGFRELVGYLPQSQQVPERLEAGRWLELWAGELGLAQSESIAREALSALGVSDLWGRRLGEMSGGQRRRVRIARTLLGDPRVLVVDEPTSGLDPEGRVELRNLLGQLSRRRLVLFSTHIAEDVAASCQRVLVLDRGRLCFDGDVERLRDRAAGKVRQTLVSDAELASFTREHRIVTRVRVLEGIRVRYLCDDPEARGESVEPTLEEAYLWLLGRRGEVRLAETRW